MTVPVTITDKISNVTSVATQGDAATFWILPTVTSTRPTSTVASRTTTILDASTITITPTLFTSIDPNTVTPTTTLTSTSRTTVTSTRPTFTSWLYTTAITETTVNWTILARSPLVVTQKVNPTSTSIVVFSTVEGGGLHIKEIEGGRINVEGENDRIFGTEDEVEEFPYLASSIQPAPFWN